MINPEISITVLESRLSQHSLRQRSCAKQELHVLPEAPAVATWSARQAPVGRTLGMHQAAAATKQDSTAMVQLGWLIGYTPNSLPSSLTGPATRAQPFIYLILIPFPLQAWPNSLLFTGLLPAAQGAQGGRCVFGRHIHVLPRCKGVLCGRSGKLILKWHCVEESIVIGSEAPQSCM
jgi:hypothetical protein